MKALILLAAIIFSGCQSLPAGAYRQFAIDYVECGMICLIDDIKQIER